MNLTQEFKREVMDAVLASRKNYGGSESNFARSLGMSPSVYSRFKHGTFDGIIKESDWLRLGRMNSVTLNGYKWNVARTMVYDQIESSIDFCQRLSKSMIMVDDCGIGKTFCAKHIARSRQNAFYFDCSQAKSKQLFVRKLAKTLGLDPEGKYDDVKENLKYYLTVLEKPILILDEAGDLEYTAFLEVKELWNATMGICGWYMLGADGLRSKIEKGKRDKRVGFAELLSRFSDEFIKVVPVGKEDKQAFYRKLVGDVATANMSDKEMLNKYVNQCITKEKSLRYLETLIKLSDNE